MVDEESKHTWSRLVIAIVNYRSAQLTASCLESLEPIIANHPDWRVVIVDNASAEGAALNDVVQRRGWEAWASVVVADRNGGFSYANNLVLRRALESSAPPKYALLLNPDTIVLPGTIEAMVQAMEDRSDLGLCGCVLREDAGEEWPFSFRFPTIATEIEAGLQLRVFTKLLGRRALLQQVVDDQAEPDWLSGACLLIRREVFRDIGLLDEGYFLYFEETDFCLRARGAGWRTCYLRKHSIIHLCGQITGVSVRSPRPPRRPKYWFDSRRRYFVKNHGAAYALGADIAFATALAFGRSKRLHRLRDAEPPSFLRDFVSHTARAWIKVVKSGRAFS